VAVALAWLAKYTRVQLKRHETGERLQESNGKKKQNAQAKNRVRFR